VIVGPDGVVKPPRVEFTRKEDIYRPGKTAQLGANRFRLGTEDVKEFGDRYTEILGREVETSRHQDPRTGKYDGIEIKSVKEGSIAARHGAQEGDVIKSINGHPVNSTQEAINFVKVNSNNYTTWEIVVENHGKTRTVTYESSNGN
jgi:C-terminal processing protease CtpA/Prc